MKLPTGRLGSLIPRPGAADGLGDRGDGRLLADDPLVEHALEVEEPLGLFLDDVGRRNSGPLLEDAGDVLPRDLGGVGLPAAGPALVLLAQLGVELLDALLEAGGLLVVLGPDGVLLLALETRYLLLDAPDVHRRHRGAQAHLGGGLVQEVYRLVRQEAVGDVAVAELGGGDDGLVRDPHPVVRLVAVPEAEEDLDGLVDRGLVHEHGLEAPLERRVLLHVLAVLVERGRADDLQLAPGERRLEHVGGVDGALGPAGPDDGVQLVYEQDDVLLLGLQLLDHLLHALLEVTAEAGAGDEAADVEREHALALERLGYVLGDDPLGEPLGDGRLADARLADEHGVVLGAPGEDAHDARYLLGAPDHRVELAVPGRLREVAAYLVQGRRAAGWALLATAPPAAAPG